MIIRMMQKEGIDDCVEIYKKAYAAEPWCEQHTSKEIKDYLLRFISSEGMDGYMLCDDEKIIGIALGIKIAYIGSDYMRMEDFCVDIEHQRQGIGSLFIKKIGELIRNKGMDSILLGTVKDYPSHKFYLKNGFREIDSSILLFKEL